MECLKNNKKKYIIPTEKWLNPLSKLITSELNNDSNIDDFNITGSKNDIKVY